VRETAGDSSEDASEERSASRQKGIAKTDATEGLDIAGLTVVGPRVDNLGVGAGIHSGPAMVPGWAEKMNEPDNASVRIQSLPEDVFPVGTSQPSMRRRNMRVLDLIVGSLVAWAGIASAQNNTITTTVGGNQGPWDGGVNPAYRYDSGPLGRQRWSVQQTALAFLRAQA